MRANAGDLVNFQRREAIKAKQLVADIRKLRREGISNALLRSMINAGESGWENIHALASGPIGDVRALNRAEAATEQALTAAGKMVGHSLVAQSRIRREREDIRAARHIEHALERVLRHHDRHTIVELHIDGKILRASLLKLKRHNGGKALGLA